MTKRSKAYKDAAQLVDRTQLYTPIEAVRLAQKTSSKNTDSTIDVVFKLGVDPRHADQSVRSTVILPHGTGKTARVLVFANGDKAEAATEAGADIVGGDELIAEVQGGRQDFDAVVATPDMRGKVGRLGKVLGPRGLMPNPKTGTVTPDVETAVNNAKAGQVRYRTDKNGIIQGGIGKIDFDAAAIRGNLEAVLADLKKGKPAASKGVYLKKISLSTTMGAGVTIDQASLTAA